MEEKNLKEIRYTLEEFMEKLGLEGTLKDVYSIYPSEREKESDKPNGVQVTIELKSSD